MHALYIFYHEMYNLCDVLPVGADQESELRKNQFVDNRT